MPYVCWLLLWAYFIEDFKWCLHFQIGGCVLKRCFEGGIFWRAKLLLKGIKDFDLKNWTWPWNCENPEEWVQRPSQHTSKIMYCSHKPSSVVWSHMWPGPQPTAISMVFYSCGSSHTIKYNKSTVVNIRSAMVSRFVLGLPPRGSGFEIRLSNHETWSIWCHVGIHVYFTSILHSQTSLVPQA